MIGLGTDITEVAEFNRRAAKALRGVDFVPGSWSKRFATDMIAAIDAGRTLTEKQQQSLYNVVHKFRRQITDAVLKDFAASRAREAD